MSLPTAPSFVTHLLNSLSALPSGSAGEGGGTNSNAPTAAPASTSAALHAAPTSNPLNAAPDAVKKQLLTLHVLFPNECLPALDLLDRRLVTRFRIQRDSQGLKEADSTPQEVHSAPSTHTPTIRAANDSPNAEAAQQTHAETRVPEGTPPTRDAVTSVPQDVDYESPDAEMRDVGALVPHPHIRQEEEEGIHLHSDLHHQQQGHNLEEAISTDVQRDSQDKDTVYYVRSAQQRSSRYTTSYDSTTSYEVRLHAWNCSCPAFAFSAFPSMHPEPSPIQIGLRDLEALQFGHGSDAASGGGGWRFGGIGLGDTMPPVCKHILACVLVEKCGMFEGFVEEKEVSVEEVAGWAAGWGD